MAGGVTALLALYLLTSLEAWARIERRVTRARVLIVYAAFLVLAACFIGAALVPVSISQVGHNVFAIGMAVIFGALLLSLRWVLPCLRWAMIALALAVAGGILSPRSLFWVGYYTLATHEMVCAGLVVGWLLLFTRTLAAAERADSRSGRRGCRFLEPRARLRRDVPLLPRNVSGVRSSRAGCSAASSRSARGSPSCAPGPR